MPGDMDRVIAWNKKIPNCLMEMKMISLQSFEFKDFIGAQ